MLNSPLNLIRYLFVLRVNGSLVWASRCAGAEVSAVLGKTIMERLPTRQARPWRKAMAAWGENGPPEPDQPFTGSVLPEKPWPIDAVLHWLPTNRSYGKGEPILLELKLMGAAADHGMFLEVILPALEYLGAAVTITGRRSTNLWGSFDIQSVYTAKGPVWKPLIQDGKLDLRCKVLPNQWLSGLKFTPLAPGAPRHLTWLTTFDLPGCAAGRNRGKKYGKKYDKKYGKKCGKKCGLKQPPSLQLILKAYLARMKALLDNGRGSSEEVKAMLDLDGEGSFDAALEEAARVPVVKHNITDAPGRSPALWIGSQTFAAPIPRTLLPYLGLASMFHVGKGVHYGCGSFALD
ncbi:MAG: hypothetical protein GY859_21235 [Desulfobacterales bacterium]|nr:hypothetical protein [Desulfobacterales bacterium]